MQEIHGELFFCILKSRKMFIDSSHNGNMVMPYRKRQKQMTEFENLFVLFLVLMFLSFCFQSITTLSFDLHSNPLREVCHS